MSTYKVPAASSAVPRPSSVASSSSSSATDDQDRAECDNFSNFGDESEQEAFSLFDQAKSFPSVALAVKYDEQENGLNLDSEVARLGLDFHQRVRLVNYIRKEQPSVESLKALSGSEPFLSSDEFLIPVLSDDAYLQIADDSWSDSDSNPDVEVGPSSSEPSSELTKANRRIRLLEEKLAALESSARAELELMRRTFADRLNIGDDVDTAKKDTIVKKEPGERDDDTHYFDSYSYNDIHEIMLKDTTRTKSYALFILSNPALFKGATVLDVGCGTGILSLLCARAGAAHVYAVDASTVAVKAIENIKKAGYADKITVVRGKVEEIQLPEGVKVDVIVSEWMGYMLLYESMLDSVLVARDRFLKPTGILAPSQTKIMLTGVDCEEFMHDRVGFWKDVYGFNFEAMAEEITEDSLVEIMNESELVTDDHCIKDILISESTIKSLDFHSTFTLRPTRNGKMHAFLAYFDTFFTPSGASHDGPVSLERFDETLKIDGRPGDKNDVSFTTGPKGVPTHWKQTLFILNKPIDVTTDSTIQGTFNLKKSKTNSRELDVEIHWRIVKDGESAEGDDVSVSVQVFKVR